LVGGKMEEIYKINYNILDKTQKVTITPEIAEKILMKNESNRTLNKDIVNKYVREIIDNQWSEFTPDPIVINLNGILLNGQHRLNAVVKSNKSVGFNLYIESNTSLTPMDLNCDLGLKRNNSDLTGINQYTTSTINFLIKRTTNIKHPTANDVLYFYNKYIKDDEFLENTLTKIVPPLWSSSSIKGIAVAFYLKNEENKEYVSEIISYLINKETLKQPELLSSLYIKLTERKYVSTDIMRLAIILFDSNNKNKKQMRLQNDIQPLAKITELSKSWK
jgi:hypothetical protein